MADLRDVYPPEIWARESLMVLSNSHVIPGLIHRDFDNEVAEFGDTVNTRKPNKGTVRSLTNTIGSTMTVDQASAEPVVVTLDQHNYTAFAVTGRDMDTSIKNLVDEFIEPHAIPMAQNVDDTLMNTTDGLASVSSSVDKNGATLQLIDFANVRKKLRQQQVPFTTTNRQSRIHIVLGVEHEGEALTVSELATANQSGFDVPPVQTGFIQVIYGMNVFADQGVPAGSASSAAGRTLAFHRNAINMTTRPLEQISSEFGIRSSVMELDGVSMRVMQSFQHTSARWVVSLDMLWGYKILDSLLATQLQDT